MRDISGSRGIEREYCFEQLEGCSPGLALDVGTGPKPKASVWLLERGFSVVAVDLEPVRKEWVVYSLKGDRKVEWGYVKTELPAGDGFLLDIGPAPGNPKPARIAADCGWQVTGVGLETPKKERSPTQRFTFVLGDFNTVEFGDTRFDWVLNISTIEHFGLKGRYGVDKQDYGADLRGMKKALGLLAKHGRMLLTIPVGLDRVMLPYHRVYGETRLPQLLAGYEILDERYYGKFGKSDEYQKCVKHKALMAEPTVNPSYYALGLFTLGRLPE